MNISGASIGRETKKAEFFFRKKIQLAPVDFTLCGRLRAAQCQGLRTFCFFFLGKRRVIHPNLHFRGAD